METIITGKEVRFTNISNNSHMKLDWMLLFLKIVGGKGIMSLIVRLFTFLVLTYDQKVLRLYLV